MSKDNVSSQFEQMIFDFFAEETFPHNCFRQKRFGLRNFSIVLNTLFFGNFWKLSPPFEISIKLNRRLRIKSVAGATDEPLSKL